MQSVDNYTRIKKWIHTLTMATVGEADSLNLLAKLEYESGLDLERIVDNVKITGDGETGFISCEHIAYGKRQAEHFPLNEAGDRFRIGHTWYEFNDIGKVAYLRTIVIKAMRSVPREKVMKQASDHLNKESARVRAALKKPGAFLDEVESIFDKVKPKG